jgi:hypothetical protein
MDMGMGGASACKSESISVQLGPIFRLPPSPSRLILPSLVQCGLPSFALQRAYSSLDALELVYRRYMLPLFHLAQQYQSQIRRIRHWRILPRDRHRGLEKVGKGLRSTYHETSYVTSCYYEWRYDPYRWW